MAMRSTHITCGLMPSHSAHALLASESMLLECEYKKYFDTSNACPQDPMRSNASWISSQMHIYSILKHAHKH